MAYLDFMSRVYLIVILDSLLLLMARNFMIETLDRIQMNPAILYHLTFHHELSMLWLLFTSTRHHEPLLSSNSIGIRCPCAIIHWSAVMSRRCVAGPPENRLLISWPKFPPTVTMHGLMDGGVANSWLTSAPLNHWWSKAGHWFPSPGPSSRNASIPVAVLC